MFKKSKSQEVQEENPAKIGFREYLDTGYSKQPYFSPVGVTNLKACQTTGRPGFFPEMVSRKSLRTDNIYSLYV